MSIPIIDCRDQQAPVYAEAGSLSTKWCVCREQHLQHISGQPLDPNDKVAYLEQAPSLRLALGRLSLERKSHKFGGQDDDDADMQQVEMLLEAYFIQMDNTFNRLETMNEYISDTEVCLVSAAVTRHFCCFVCVCMQLIFLEQRMSVQESRCFVYAGVH